MQGKNPGSKCENRNAGMRDERVVLRQTHGAGKMEEVGISTC